MSSQSTARTLFAIVGAIVMSTVALGAAVGPAQANAHPVSSSVGAAFNA
jgi:hypothetical protein